jgi:hypothetical protein
MAKADSKNQLKISKDKLGHKSLERIDAEIAQSTVTLNAQTVRLFAHGTIGTVDLTESVELLQEKTEKVCSGDLSGPEAILTAQAVALDVIFNEMARRAALNMGEHLQATDTYIRLAMRAQGQCRATLQTLGELKNPRQVAFVKQANIAHGHQQVNNHSEDCIYPRTGDFPTNKLSGEGNELLPDTRASSFESNAHQEMETLGAIHRPQNARG